MTRIDHIFSIVDANLDETHRNLQTPGYCQSCGKPLEDDRKDKYLCLVCLDALAEQDDREYTEFLREWATNPKYSEDRRRDRSYLEHMEGQQ